VKGKIVFNGSGSNGVDWINLAQAMHYMYVFEGVSKPPFPPNAGFFFFF
jgi:hypothetical protein